VVERLLDDLYHRWNKSPIKDSHPKWNDRAGYFFSIVYDIEAR
jgi:hypothetical protein